MFTLLSGTSMVIQKCGEISPATPLVSSYHLTSTLRLTDRVYYTMLLRIAGKQEIIPINNMHILIIKKNDFNPFRGGYHEACSH